VIPARCIRTSGGMLARRLLNIPMGPSMLERFFKKYLWAANLLLLFLVAWLLAKMGNTFVAVAIRPRPAVDLSLPSSTTPRQSAQIALDPQRLYRLIGMEPPAAQEAAAMMTPVRPQTCNDATATPVRSDLRLALVASVLSEQPKWSLATLLDLGSREARIYGVGDAVQGATLVGLQRIREERDITGNAFKIVAILCNGGTKEYVDFDEAAAAAAGGEGGNVGVAPVPPPRSFPGGKGPAAPMQGVRMVSDNKYDVSRTVIDQQLSNLSTISTQARIVPSFKNGVANGFKLFSIQPGSLYASIGVENGDVIQRINGYEINSPDRALELFQKLKESSHVTIELERGGTPVRKEYNISGP
jgi:general secretion pathway protein C